MASQTYTESKERFRDGDGDGEEEEDGEEMLDPRVKGELDRLNSSTAEINRLEQDLEELQATFRQTLTESAYILKSQASFLGKCINQARPYYDAVRKAKQSQIETQKAALKYERACSAQQSAKKMLARAEQKLVSTSKEHKVLDPTWQEMLNQAVLKVMESDKERALSEREHLETARAFGQAGSQVVELRTKLKSAISKSRPYFDLKMKYDQILEAHKKQVEITQEGLQEAKRKYSLALKNLEGISEEIHEMRKSRDSLDTILNEREQGVGAESPVGDFARDSIRPETNFPFKDLGERSALKSKPFYGLKIALVSATRHAQTSKTMVVEEAKSGMPVGERDGDPEGCSSVDEQQLYAASKHHELSSKVDSESESVIYQGENDLTTLKDQMCDSTVSVESNKEVLCESLSSDSKASISQVEKTVLSVESSVSSLGDKTEVIDTSLSDKEQEKFVKVLLATEHGAETSENEKRSTTGFVNQQLAAGNKDSLTTVLDKDSSLSHTCEATTQESAYMTDPLEQSSTSDTANKIDLQVEDNASTIADNYETHNAFMKQESVATATSTEQQSENSVISEGTPDEKGTQTVTDNGESNSISEADQQQDLTENIADGSSVLIEQESSTPSSLGEEELKFEILPSSDQVMQESSSVSTEDNTK
ncbi:hypothetical protein ACROYT_G026572 [Oculina patagonica]